MSRLDGSQLAPLLEAGRRLVTSTTSGRILQAKLARGIDPALVPPEAREAVEGFIARASQVVLDPLSPRDLHAVLRDAWDAEPRDELDELDEVPVAVTPTAQVHRGLLDGQPVAVKVLRPGLSGLFRQDLVLLETLAPIAGSLFPRIDVAALLREVRERTLDEFDLEHEAAAQRRFHRALRRHPYLQVPAPVTRLASERVMVSQWAEGLPLLDAPDRERAGAQLVVFTIGSLREGFVHADPDPQDILVGRSGGLTILDFGATRAVAGERVEWVLQAVEAFAGDDREGFAAALSELGFLPHERGSRALELANLGLGPLGGSAPSRLDVPELIAAGERLDPHAEEVLRLVLEGSVAPEDLWPGRAVIQLLATLCQLGATAPWRELVLRALRDGWSAELPA